MTAPQSDDKSGRSQFGEGHDKPCYYCGEPCNSLAADPGRWPIPLCHRDDPGRVKWHHERCVCERLIENQPTAPLPEYGTPNYDESTIKAREVLSAIERPITPPPNTPRTDAVDAEYRAYIQSGVPRLNPITMADTRTRGAALALVEKQAKDGGLWFNAELAPEAYLQRALRELHAAVEYDARSTSGDSERLAAMTKATYSHVDGRDLLHQLQPNGAHYIDIVVRINGEDRRYEGDWLKTLTWARDGHNMGEHADNPKLRAHIESARAAGDSGVGTGSGTVSAIGTPENEPGGFATTGELAKEFGASDAEAIAIQNRVENLYGNKPKVVK